MTTTLISSDSMTGRSMRESVQIITSIGSSPHPRIPHPSSLGARLPRHRTTTHRRAVIASSCPQLRLPALNRRLKTKSRAQRASLRISFFPLLFSAVFRSVTHARQTLRPEFRDLGPVRGLEDPAVLQLARFDRPRKISCNSQFHFFFCFSFTLIYSFY